MVNTEDGPKIDWDCYARHCSASWEEILSGKLPEAEVRVFITTGDYYNFGFAEDSVWKGYEISSPELGETVLAYVKRGSQAAHQLSVMDITPPRAILRIRLTPADIAHRQCEITGLIAEGWVKPF